MEPHARSDYAGTLSSNLLWIGIVTLLVGVKLVLSYFVPGLKTPGELVLSGGLLLVTTVRVFALRRGLQSQNHSSFTQPGT
jgi:hypothetical protein